MLGAHIIAPTLSSVFEETYRAIHRPHPDLKLALIVEGLKQLRKIYKGQILLEIVLLAGFNDNEKELEGLKKVVAQISPDKIQLNTVVRPPVDSRAVSLDRQRLEDIQEFFGGKAEIIADIPPSQRRQAFDSLVKTILDTAGPWLEEGIKAKPYLIKPNVHETEELLKTELPTEEAIIEAARKLVKMGIEVVVISRGKDGIIVATKETIIKGIPPVLKVRSAVGAGDCTVAGLALKIAEGATLIEACRLGVAMGAATVLTPGTELCHRADVERLLPQVEVWEATARKRAKVSFAAANQ